MNKKFFEAIFISGLGGWSAVHAQSFANFGPLNNQGDSDSTPILDVSASPAAVHTHAVFAASVTIVPNYGTPAGSTESYTVTWNDVQLTLSSASGGLKPSDPATLDLGKISGTFSITLPAVKPPSSYPSSTFNFSVTKDFSTAYVASTLSDNFTVTASKISSPVSSGGKTDSLSESVSITGTVAVPEPSHYAFASAVGLLGLGLVLRRR